jgi:zinc and cadmium transporter
MSVGACLTLYCVWIFLASILGGGLPIFGKIKHTALQTLLSFIGGLMLGVALLHMLPHSARTVGIENATVGALVGLLAMFFLIRIFHFHQHEAPGDQPHSHDADCTLHHQHEPSDHWLSWIGIAIGLAIHTLIDGVALAASVQQEAGDGVMLLGFGTFLAVMLHKPLDALSITTVMTAGGWSKRSAMVVNAAFASMCPIGALLFFYAGPVITDADSYVGLALGFSAGVFLCISLADLLPEVQFHHHDRLKLSAAMLSGVFLAYILESDLMSMLAP